MTELELAVEQLAKKYQIVETFRYSDIAAPNGEKQLYDQLYRVRKDYFEPNERIVFLQDCNDDYEYNDDLGKYTDIIQREIGRAHV